MEAIKPTIEQHMNQEGALMVKRVTGLTITNDAEYERGGMPGMGRGKADH